MTDKTIKKNNSTEERLDCLFVYVGRSGSLEYDLMLMPMGFLALADFLVKNNIRTKVLNLYLQKIKDPGFSLEKMISLTKPRVICFSVHWHPQMADTIRVIGEVKKKFPSVLTVVGGFTASGFYKDIMSNERAVDFIIRGDGEIPLLLLAKSLLQKETVALKDIPNLCWRNKGKIVINHQTYSVVPEIFDSLNYANFDILYGKETYLKGIWGWRKGQGLEGLKERKNIFYYSPARGCPFECSFCGGGRGAQQVMNNRCKTIVKSSLSVLADLKTAKKHGVEALYICADPLMNSGYYEKLFNDIRNSGLKFTAFFEHFALPSEEFVRAFSRTFGRDSVIILSPETGSELVRKKNKGVFYSNAALMSSMKRLSAAGIGVELYFTAGLPFETKKYFMETVKFIGELRKKFKFRLYAFPLHLEPLSPLLLNPKKYGVIAEKRGYKDFMDKRFDLGYSTKYFSKKEILSNIGILQKF
jgi:radical SAM superfamily enzyme YgiQ (UPF0313 family)